MKKRSQSRSRRLQRLGQIVALAASIASAQPVRADDTSVPVAPVTEEAMAEARLQFKAGISLLEDPESPRYEEAYNAFKRSFELSRSPKVLGNVALCAFYLERDGEAIDLYTTYLRDVANIAPLERAQIERDLATLRATAATVEIHVQTQGDAVFVDRRTQTRANPVENAYPFVGDRLVVRVRAGRHTFVVKGPDGETFPVDATIQPATSTRYELAVRPVNDAAAPPPVVAARRSLVGPVVLGVAGVLAVGAGVATGLAARSQSNDIAKQCPNDTCPQTYDGLASDRATGKTFATVADFSFVGGGVLLGGAILWYALLPPKTIATRRAALSPLGMCLGTGCKLGLQGTF